MQENLRRLAYSSHERLNWIRHSPQGPAYITGRHRLSFATARYAVRAIDPSALEGWRASPVS